MWHLIGGGVVFLVCLIYLLWDSPERDLRQRDQEMFRRLREKHEEALRRIDESSRL
jgi:hypothetical protein